MFKSKILVLLMLLMCLPLLANATEENMRLNPDGNKYEFARSYISALKYLRAIEQRWQNDPPSKTYAKHDIQLIKVTINYITMDSAQLRIAKNYMVKYLDAPNQMMRKVADMFVGACDIGIVYNDKEKELWQKWGDLKYAGEATPEREKKFRDLQEEIGRKRREAYISIIEASSLMTRVMIKANNSKEDNHRLAVTIKELAKLSEKLDSYGKDVLDWGVKPGQYPMEASIAVIREVLEDSLWVPIDAK